MNIGIFTDTYFPQISGVATSIKMLEKELNNLGHKVFIFTTTDPEATEPVPRVFRIKSMPFLFFRSRRVAYYYSPKLLTKIKDFELDIVHTQTEFSLGFFGKGISEYCKIPLVHTYHTMYEDYVHYIANGHLITPKMAQSFSRFFCNRATRVIAPVEKAKNSLLKYGVIRPIDIVPTGIEFERYKKENYTKDDVLKIKDELGLNYTDPIILSLGRISKEKSVDVIIKEMPKLLEKIPNAKLVIIGDGPMLGEVKQLVCDMKIENSVIIAGSRPWEEIGKYYQLGDIFVSASKSETQGLTYIEAMAAKIPLVVRKDESLKGVVTDKIDGYLFEEEDGFVKVACEVLNNLDEAEKVALAGYEKIQSLSAKQFAKNIEKVYSMAIEDHKIRSATTIRKVITRNIKNKLVLRKRKVRK